MMGSTSVRIAARHMPGLGAEAQIALQRLSLGYQLLQFNNLKVLAATVIECDRNRPCNSGACPSCQRLAASKWVRHSVAFANTLPPDTPIVRTIIVSDDVEAGSGRLCEFILAIPRFAERLRQQFHRSPLRSSIVIGRIKPILIVTGAEDYLWRIAAPLIIFGEYKSRIAKTRESIAFLRASSFEIYTRTLTATKLLREIFMCVDFGATLDDYVKREGKSQMLSRKMSLESACELATFYDEIPDKSLIFLRGLRRNEGGFGRI